MVDLYGGSYGGCHRACAQRGEHTRIFGGCQFGVEPESTVSMPHTFKDADERNTIGFNEYTLQELADLIEPALRQVTIHFGPNSRALVARGEPVRLSGGEAAELARLAAHAIIHRNDVQPSTGDQSGTFTVSGCTCHPWTTQDGESRTLEPDDSIDLISGWQRNPKCPHHGTGPADGRQKMRLLDKLNEELAPVLDGFELVTSLPCNWARVRQVHDPHPWEPQPGMTSVHCPGHPVRDKRSECFWIVGEAQPSCGFDPGCQTCNGTTASDSQSG